MSSLAHLCLPATRISDKGRSLDGDELPNASAGIDTHYFALPPGSLLFEFEIVSVLGHGGFGITYLAIDTLLQEKVAIKEFFPSLAARATDSTVRAKSRGEQIHFESGLRSFLEEARLIARFRHQNIVHVRRFFEANGTGYIVQDYIEGKSLLNRLEKGSISASELRDLLSGVLNGLELVHSQAVLHRDLKPDNILLRNDGTPVLIDFGAARDFGVHQSQSITAIAAGGYTPPEQWGTGGQQGPWSDLYALGAVLYRCVTGITPPISLQRLRKDPLTPAIQSTEGRFDDALLRAIDWMLCIDEADRPQSVAALRPAFRSTGIIETAPNSRAEPLGVTKVQDGYILDVGTRVEADLLELAFRVTPPDRYIGRSVGERIDWQDQPHYFSLFRAENDTTGRRFLLRENIGSHFPREVQIVVSSRDNFIRAPLAWPTTDAPPVRRKRTGFAALAVAIVALLFASYVFWTWLEERRTNLVQQVHAAEFDRTKIEEVQKECGRFCFSEVRAEIERRIALIEAEERLFYAAQNNQEKLRAYIKECEACKFKQVAAEQIAAIELSSLTSSLVSASGDRNALTRWLQECPANCPEQLKSRALQELDSIEENHYREARGSSERLENYLAHCYRCKFRDEARKERVSIEEKRIYNQARDDVGRLEQYLSNCTICAFRERARQTIALAKERQERARRAEEERLERARRAEEERQTYHSARGDIALLNSYISGCRICENETEARREVERLERANKLFDLWVCNKSGRKVSVAIAVRREPDDPLTVIGWYNYTPGECARINTFARGWVYYMARDYNGSSYGWRGNALKLCVRNSRFERINSTNYTCRTGEKLEGFFGEYVSDSKYTWTLRP